MNDVEIAKQRKFWKKVLISGIMTLILAILIGVVIYLTGMREAAAGADSEIEREIATLGARSAVLFKAAIWMLPIAIIASLLMNVARYKLRKLKKLENSAH